MDPQHAFVFEERPTGFTLSSPFYPSVYVEIADNGQLTVDTRPRPRPRSGVFGAHQYKWFVEAVASYLLCDYDERRPDGRIVPMWVKRNDLARRLSRRLAAQRNRLLDLRRPGTAAIVRRFMAHARQVPALATWPGLFDRPYLLQDLLTFPAAALAVAHLDLLQGYPPPPWWDDPTCADLRRLAEALTASEAKLGPLGEDYYCTAADLAARWRDLLSPTGRAYRALHVTLTHWPGNIGGFALHLRFVKLARPVTRRRELLAILAAAYVNTSRPAAFGATLALDRVMHADDGEIVRAVTRFLRHTGHAFSANKVSSFAYWATFLADSGLGHAHRGNLVTLTEAAIAVHRGRGTPGSGLPDHLAVRHRRCRYRTTRAYVSCRRWGRSWRRERTWVTASPAMPRAP